MIVHTLEDVHLLLYAHDIVYYNFGSVELKTFFFLFQL